ncbi:MAG TPA: MCE family protein [Acidimicrobiales bacterium]
MFGDVPYRIRVMTGLIAVVLIMGVVVVVVGASNGKFSTGYDVHAVFTRAGQGLYTGNEIKVRGVGVGSVSGFRLQPDDSVNVTLHIRHGVRLPTTVTASIEPLSVFGPTYVNLTPGANEKAGPYLAPGATIAHTVPPTALLDVLSRTSGLLNAIDTTDLSTVIDTLGAALAGTGAQIASTVDSAGVITAHATADLPKIQALLSQVATLSATLGPRGGEVASVATNLSQVLPSIADHPDQVTALLDQTSQLAADVSTLLEGHQPALDQIVNGLSAVVATAYQGRANLPPLVLSLKSFFNFLGGIIRLPGESIPGDRLSGNLEGYLPTDPCQLLFGICGR